MFWTLWRGPAPFAPSVNTSQVQTVKGSTTKHMEGIGLRERELDLLIDRTNSLSINRDVVTAEFVES